MRYIVCLLLFLSFHIDAYKHDVSVCAIFQDESDYLKEWLDYHMSIGVEHFYLYNNNSKDAYLLALAPYITSGKITLIEWPSKQESNDWKNFSFTVQTGAYNDAIKRTRKITKWLAIIDTDEFIVPVMYGNISYLMEKEYSDVSGLCVNWQCYGTSHVDKFPSGKMLKNLTMKMKWDHEWNNHSKSIVRPDHVTACVNPHYCVYKSGYWAVDANRDKCDNCPSRVCIGKIRLNHYWTRDEWFLWNIKIPRYLKWGNTVDGVLKHAQEMNEEYDPILAL